MKFLVVDDDPAILALLTEILLGFGYENIVSAQSGFQALQTLQDAGEPFDCLMLDIQMPEMDGIDLCRAVRAMPDYLDTPIVMITAMREEPYISRAFAAGATDYTTKPFDVHELMERIKVAEGVNNGSKAQPSIRKRKGASSRRAANPARIEGVISRQAINNYARILLKRPSVSLAASVISVPELETFAASKAAADDECVVRKTIDTIHDTLVGTRACMSYIGDGNFLCVCSQSNTLDEMDVQAQLNSALDRLRLDAKLPASFGVDIGRWTQPKVFERASALSFIDRAIAAQSRGQVSNLQSAPRSLTGRLMAMF